MALIQALVIIIQNEDDYPDTHIQILESNKWQAVRYGLDGAFIDPTTYKQLSIRKAIENLCIFIEPIMVSLGSIKYIRVIEEILKQGTGATKQRELYNNSGNFKYMIQSLKEQFYE